MKNAVYSVLTLLCVWATSPMVWAQFVIDPDPKPRYERGCYDPAPQKTVGRLKKEAEAKAQAETQAAEAGARIYEAPESSSNIKSNIKSNDF